MKKQYILDSVALIGGALLTLAFAPFKLKLLATIAPALLLYTWLNAGKGRAFWRGWLFGIGHFGTGVYWVYISIHQFGGVGFALSYLISFGFIALLALFPALLGLWLNALFPAKNAAKMVFAFPVYWVVLEWLRGWIFTGFPWLTLGDSQIHYPLAGWAPIFSAYGVSLATTMTSGLLVFCFHTKQKKRLLSIASIILLWTAGYSLNQINWTTPGKTQSVTLVQGNIPQSIKWSEDQVEPTVTRYLRLSQPYWTRNNIIIWPEAAIPLPIPAANDLLSPITEQAAATQSTLISGIPVEDLITGKIFNSIVAISATDSRIYSKRHLVPFGEYFPARSIMSPLLGILNIPMSNFNPGPEAQKNIVINDIRFANFICYEIAFSNEVRHYLHQANVMLVLSDDAWFGHSSAQAQHQEIAQMRAIETGRYVLFGSNNGITAIINNRGVIEGALPAFQTAVLNGQFTSMSGSTPWLYIGPWGLAILLLLILTPAWLRRT